MTLCKILSPNHRHHQGVYHTGRGARFATTTHSRFLKFSKLFFVAEDCEDTTAKSMPKGKKPLQKELNGASDEKENKSEREPEPFMPNAFNLSDCETDPDEPAEKNSEPEVL